MVPSQEQAEDEHRCPICDEAFKPDDNCATDIELGTCHFDCLDGSPAVDLETGDELPDEDMHSFPYSDVMDPPPQEHSLGTIDCPCTLIEQDEDCPVGYPSMMCGVCKGIGNTTPEQVTALTCETMKIASVIGEPEDPFAAWESIDLIKNQHGQLRKVVNELKFALFASDMIIKDRADQSARLVLAATMEG